MYKIILLLCLVAAVKTEQFSYNGYKVFQVHPQTEIELLTLKSIEHHRDLDFWDQIHVTDKSIRIMCTPNYINEFKIFLENNQINYKLIIYNVERVLKKERDYINSRSRISTTTNIVDFEYFWKLNEIYNYIDSLANKYPELVEVEDIGKSYENRSIKAIKISLNGKVSDKNPIMLVDATMHAREWISTMVAVNLIRELVENKDKNIRLLDGLDWIIVPVINVDGYLYTHETERLWRKTRSPNINSTCIGTDLNRNFDINWQLEGGSSTDPCSTTFRGSAPSSEVETQVISKLIEKYTKKKLYLSIHSYGKYILYPYGHDYNEPIINRDEHEEVGKQVRFEIYSVNGTYYDVGNSAHVLYKNTGSSTDYAITKGNLKLSFLVELPGGGNDGFDIEPERIKGVFDEIFPGLLKFSEYVLSKYKD